MDTHPEHTQAADITSAIEKSGEFSRELYRLQPDSVSLPPLPPADDLEHRGAVLARLRLTVAGALFSISLDHHATIVFLLRNDRRSSAFALLRAVFDATWRGAWAAFLAESEQLDDFIAGRYDPKPEPSIRYLERLHALPPVLSRVRLEGWSAMSAYVHGGSLQVQRWIRDGVVEPRHSDGEVVDVLHLADRLAFMACVLFLSVAKQERDDLAAVAERFLGVSPK